MLSPQMIAAMRTISNATMSASATVSRRQLTDDGLGTKTDSWAAVHVGVPCRVQEVPRNPNTMAPQGGKQEYANHVVKVPWGTDILPSDKLLITDDKGGTSTFQIDSPYDNTQDGGTSSYYCYKVS